MNKDFVPYQLALDMKSIGFNEPCFGYYNELGNFNLEIDKTNASCNKPGMYGKYCTKLTFSQAFGFFREEHGLHSYIERLISGAFIYKIDWFQNEEDKHNKIVWECKSYSYEETRLELLKKLIQLIKDNII